MRINALLIVAIIALLLCPACTTLTADSSISQDSLFRGIVQVMIADDFKGQTAQTYYHLISEKDGAMLGLNFLNALPEPALVSGSRVEIRGQRQNGKLNVETLRVLTTEKQTQ